MRVTRPRSGATPKARRHLQPRQATGSDVWVGGIDGCPAGWIACLQNLRTGLLRFRIFGTIACIARWPEQPAMMAIDMPIGFADRAERGGRRCEREARALLGVRASSVFAIPCRAAILATSYADALRLNRASSPESIGLSKQVWNIVPKMREVDEVLRAGMVDPQRLLEAHPELAFARMNGDRALKESKRSARGQRGRLTLLRSHGCAAVARILDAYPRSAASIDDILDATALCRTARLALEGKGRRLPAEPEHDSFGLPMAIAW